MSAIKREELEKKFLNFVFKPAKYLGNEIGSVHKTPQNKIRTALVVTQGYVKAANWPVLLNSYYIINQNPDFFAERFFALSGEAYQILKQGQDLPLFSLETHTPLSEFDWLLFLVNNSLEYPSILQILHQAQIPFFTHQRQANFPLLSFYSSLILNPEPVADFFDFIIFPELEERLELLLTLFDKRRVCGYKKEQMLQELSKISGIYVPSFYCQQNTKLPKSSSEKIEINKPVQPKFLEYLAAPIVPWIETFDDRLKIELIKQFPPTRGIHTSFSTYLSYSQEEALEKIEKGLKRTGYEEVFVEIPPQLVVENLEGFLLKLKEVLVPEKVRLNLSALHPKNFTYVFCKALSEISKPKIRLWIGAGNQIQRVRLNLELSDEEILEACENIYQVGWHSLILIFYTGVPEEEKQDLEAIVEIFAKIKSLSKKMSGKREVEGYFKFFPALPFTPWQIESLPSLAELEEKTHFLYTKLKGTQLRFQNIEEFYTEQILNQGQRNFSRIIQQVFDSSIKLTISEKSQEGSYIFDFKLWKQALEQAKSLEQIPPETPESSSGSGSTRDKVDFLPWNHIQIGADPDQLREERRKFYENPLDFSSTAHFSIPTLKVEESQTLPAQKQNEEDLYGRSRKRAADSYGTIAKSIIRLRWEKTERVRFLSHLDLVRIFEMSFRKTEIPIAYDQGMRPRPKISFGPPLPLGYISDSEYLDIQLENPNAKDVVTKFSEILPEGLRFTAGRTILTHTPSLTEAINVASYQIKLEKDYTTMSEAIAEFNKKSTLKIIRKTSARKNGGKEKSAEVELKDKVISLLCEPQKTGCLVKMLLVIGKEGYAKPSEILTYGLGFKEDYLPTLLIKRDGLFVKQEDRFLSPLDVI